MPAETLHCPACGSPASSNSVRCGYCGGALATVACPDCFGMMFVGAKFCARCGAGAARTEAESAEKRLCPRCHADMKTVMLGQSTVRECGQCSGLWLDPETLRRICTDHERQAAILSLSPGPAGELRAEKIQYVPCPVCGELMNRVNFARKSHVIVDVCRSHGTWFDIDELCSVVEFIRAGGLERARAQELAALGEERRRLAAEKQFSGTSFGAIEPSQGGDTRWGTLLEIILDIVSD